ncbi:helix-turn-helix transcriptional regulator [Cellulomonas sp.]|uniref:helix-turn-helix domain-containing protein n=1 Tax=Cellulomonas sp. TaxID=40001 RepID=UPI001B20ED25|nr:helix-turn-helix transcriptional regulator [Cellulomonas sp.]MBO9555547.1 helix-turn-helix transcriptional regulator [Cellulomonas sp.]
MTRWWQYVRSVAGSASQKEIAEAAGVSQPTVSRWAKGEIERATADVAVRFAVHYEASVGEALVAAGVIDAHHLPVTVMRNESPDDEMLIALLSERLRRDREELVGNGQQPAPTKGSRPAEAGPVSVADYTLAASDDETVDREMEAHEEQP